MNPSVQNTPGHHESVLRSHRSRTVGNSAAYVVEHLRKDTYLLDVGCGPGTITLGLAKLLPDGKVLGIDSESSVLKVARLQANEEVSNVDFEQGDVLNLRFQDHTFDVVHAHQLIQHVTNPLQALSEMRRVTKSGGVVAVRETDFPLMTWFPESPGLQAWKTLYMKVAYANGGEPTAGRQLHDWAHQAGFAWEDITTTTSTWCFSTPADRSWWSSMWADRTLHSAFAKQAKNVGLASEDQLQQIAQAWHAWGDHPAGWFLVVHGEIICRQNQ